MLYNSLRRALGGLRNRENITTLSTVVMAIAARASAVTAMVEAVRKNDRSQLLQQTEQLTSEQGRVAAKLQKLEAEIGQLRHAQHHASGPSPSEKGS